jgi:hypothetical protein
MDRRVDIATVVHRDPAHEIVGPRLRVLHHHVEPAAVVEHAGVEQLVLHLVPRPAPVGLDQVGIRKGGLRAPCPTGVR